MLTITIPANSGTEYYDEAKNEFVSIGKLNKPVTLHLEHSLVSVSKWEAKWHKPFLGTGRKSDKEKTKEEIKDYIKCMTLDKNVPDVAYDCLTNKNISEIEAYITNPMTATTFGAEQQKGRREIVTSELIYYWMVALNINFECEKWHLNRLLTLIRICNIMNQPKKKVSQKDQAARYAKMNKERRARMKSSG